MVVTGAHIEAHGTRDAVFLGIIHQKVGDTDTVVDLVSRCLRSFGHKWLVGFTVNHDLPAAFT